MRPRTFYPLSRNGPLIANDLPQIRNIAWEAIDQQDSELTFELIDQALKIDPTDGYSYELRGIAYGLMGDYKRAVQDIEYFLASAQAKLETPTLIAARKKLLDDLKKLPQRLKASKKYLPLTKLEQFVPILFAVIYAVLFVTLV